MTATELLKASEDLEAYLATYDDLFGRKENKEHFRRFARGQLGTIERKSLEPMADAESVSPRALQMFFSRGVWDEGAVRDELRRKVKVQYGGSDGILVIDPTSDAKKGEHTAGVGRQYCGESGKIDNCIVTVHLAYTRGDFRALVDGQEFGGKPWFRDAVGGLGFYYVFEVPRTTRGVVYEPFKDGESTEPLSVEALGKRARGLRLRPWEMFRVHRTEKGPDVWEFKAAPFWEARGDTYGRVKWLLIGRNVLTRELKYFLSNAPAGTPIEALLQVAFSRWTIERCFEDCKTELGLNHAETRKYPAIQRHLILTAVNYFFIEDWVLRARRGGKGGPDGEPVCGCHSDAA